MNSLYDDSQIPGFTALAKSVHKEGAKLCVHLMHGGLEAYPFFTKNKRLVSPSGGIFGPNQMRFAGMDLSKTSMVSSAMTPCSDWQGRRRICCRGASGHGVQARTLWSSTGLRAFYCNSSTPLTSTSAATNTGVILPAGCALSWKW